LPQATLQKDHNRLIDAAAVIQALLPMRKEMAAGDARARELNLEPDELVFYDAVAASGGTQYEQAVLRGLIHDGVHAMKRNLKVHRAEEHRPQVYAQVRAAVRRVLQRRGVRPEHLEPITLQVMEQAKATFANWPLLAL
jgi:type I restriction enzyme R subunit